MELSKGYFSTNSPHFVAAKTASIVNIAGTNEFRVFFDSEQKYKKAETVLKRFQRRRFIWYWPLPEIGAIQICQDNLTLTRAKIAAIPALTLFLADAKNESVEILDVADKVKKIATEEIDEIFLRRLISISF